MEHRRERRQAVRAGHCDLAHDIDLYRPDLTECYPHLRFRVVTRNPGIFPGKDLPHFLVRLPDGQPVQVERPYLRNQDVPFRGYLLTDIRLIGPPDIDNYLVAWPQFVMLGSGDIFVRLESQVRAVENITPENGTGRVPTSHGCRRRRQAVHHLQNRTVHRAFPLPRPTVTPAMPASTVFPSSY